MWIQNGLQENLYCFEAQDVFVCKIYSEPAVGVVLSNEEAIVA